MKVASVLLALAGVGLGIFLVLWLGAGKVVQAMLSVGWAGFGIFVGWELVVIAVLGAAWRLVCPGARIIGLVWGRLVREGACNILPFSELGGLAFGARAATLTGVPGPRAIASSIADIAAEFIGEIPFVLFAFAMLILRRPGSSMILPLGIGIGLLAAGVAALAWAERHSGALFHGIGRRVAARFVRSADEQANRVQDEFDDVFSRTRRLGLAAVIHCGGWIAGGIAVWIGYRLLGAHVDMVSAMALEGLLSGALAIAFLVPAGIGVQEASYVALGRLFGIPAQVSLSLSLLRRARDIAIGASGLASWQLAEAWRLSRGTDNRA